jgi:hypothetical protein
MLSAKVSNLIAPASHTIAFTNPDKYLDYYNTGTIWSRHSFWSKY